MKINTIKPQGDIKKHLTHDCPCMPRKFLTYAGDYWIIHNVFTKNKRAIAKAKKQLDAIIKENGLNYYL